MGCDPIWAIEYAFSDLLSTAIGNAEVGDKYQTCKDLAIKWVSGFRKGKLKEIESRYGFIPK